MKKLLKTLMTLLAAVCAVIGGLYVYRRFFAKDEELDEVFDEDNAADDDEEEDRAKQRDIRAFVDEDETEDMKPAVDDSDDFGDDEEDSDDIIKKLAAKHGATANLSRG